MAEAAKWYVIHTYSGYENKVAQDIEKVVDILEGFVDRGNTVIVIEHNTDVMKLADYIIDIGPDGGTKGGEVVFTGTPKEMLENGTTITAKYLRK